MSAEPIGRLDLPDSPYLDEDFLGSLQPGQDLLLAILGATSSPAGSTSRAQALAQQQAQFEAAQDAERARAITGAVSSAIDLFANRNNKTSTTAPHESPLDVYNGIVDPAGWAGYPTGT